MVTYHQVTDKDFDELAMILSNQWATPEIRNNPIAMKHSGLMSLYYFMVHHTYTCVAEDNGKDVGLLICTDVKNRPIDMKYAKLLIGEVAFMICNPETRDDGLAWGEYTKLARDLEDRTASGIDAELELFCLAPEYRGQGIGKRMFHSMVEFYKKTGTQNFFLHTDTSCTYPFYERRGMTRIGSQQTDIKSGDIDGIEMYIYAADVNDIR